MTRSLSGAIYALGAIMGVLAFMYPLFIGALIGPERLAANQDELPLLAMALLMLALGALLIELHGRAINARRIATLGLLVAATSVLRFLETAIPGPGGFSPIFAPIILTGYVFGARFGFLMGALTLLASAVITGGIGPWLPYQVFAAGWVGLTAGWLPHFRNSKWEIFLLAAFSFAWGILFGAILNLYFWPFLAGTSAASGQSGVLARYAVFYFSTSFAWDMARAIGNGLLILAVGAPVIRALNRFRDRMEFTSS